MAEIPEPTRRQIGPLPTVGELELSEERQAILGPKLAALLAELRKIEELEEPELEPAAAGSWERDADVRR
jgi:hypothetical protein